VLARTFWAPPFSSCSSHNDLLHRDHLGISDNPNWQPGLRITFQDPDCLQSSITMMVEDCRLIQRHKNQLTLKMPDNEKKPRENKKEK
ncbi:MAG TPA: hypothetical protein VMX97_03995, partial [Hyphomicrobiaceae bacterium]|nr:hypothetical protein [Hyphomicrobiaceae bacterium]